MTFSWYYIYSPKYEIFHQILYNCIGNTSFHVVPVFVPQEAFQNLYNPREKHFFSGSVLKIELIVEALKANPNKHILCSDADIIVNNPEAFSRYLESYTQYDITFMKDNIHNNDLCAAFGFLKSSPVVIEFFKSVLCEIRETNGLDQTIMNRLLPSFKGSVGCFSMPEVIQSNLATTETPFYVIQLLCSNNNTYEQNMYEKLVTAAALFDISDVLHLVPVEVKEALITHFKANRPSHYLAQL